MDGIGHGRASVLDGPRFDLVLGALVHALDVGLDLALLDAPLSAAADLDRSEIAGADEGAGLSDRDVEQFGTSVSGRKRFSTTIR
jgi:hypothetical protein